MVAAKVTCPEERQSQFVRPGSMCYLLVRKFCYQSLLLHGNSTGINSSVASDSDSPNAAAAGSVSPDDNYIEARQATDDGHLKLSMVR